MCDYLKLQKRQRNPFLKHLYEGLKDQINADELIFKRVRIAEELRDVVRDALREDYKIVLDLAETPDVVHSVGLETVDRRRGHYSLTSTHVQHHLRGVVTLGYVFPYLEQSSEPPRILYPFNDTNLTLIAA